MHVNLFVRYLRKQQVILKFPVFSSVYVPNKIKLKPRSSKPNEISLNLHIIYILNILGLAKEIMVFNTQARQAKKKGTEKTVLKQQIIYPSTRQKPDYLL